MGFLNRELRTDIREGALRVELAFLILSISLDVMFHPANMCNSRGGVSLKN